MTRERRVKSQGQDRDPGGLFDAWAERAIQDHSAALGGPAILYAENLGRLIVRFANGEIRPDGRRGVDRERALAIEMLEAAVAGHDVLAGWIGSSPQVALLQKIYLTPTLFFEPGRERMYWRPVGPPVATPWILLAGAMLLTTREPEVGRCRLQTCQRFFVIERGKVGKPQTKYCSEDHRLAQHALGATDRKRRSREDAKKDKSRKPK